MYPLNRLFILASKLNTPVWVNEPLLPGASCTDSDEPVYKFTKISHILRLASRLRGGSNYSVYG